MISADINLKRSLNVLSNIFRPKKPLIKLFRTESLCYLYDSGTNKILKCDVLTFSLLKKLYSMDFDEAVYYFIDENGKENLLETISTLKASIEKHNLFGLHQASNFDLFPTKRELKESINTMSNLLGLEVTERCNLRCLYCVYNEANKESRIHGKKNMEIDTAFAAIDYLKKHSSDSNEVSIVFYGGEPLLNLPVIKNSIEYANKIFTDQKVSFSMTTNATQITPEISRYLFNNNVSVKVSIDGPEDVHDRYRIDSKNKGSYRKTIRGLKNLYEAYGDIFSVKVSINMVYAPPFSSVQIEKRVNLWDQLYWLPDDILASISYYIGPRLADISHNEDKDLLQWAFEDYFYNKKRNKRPHPLAISLIEKSLAVLSQRALYKEATNKFALNGCCIPGLRRIFVTTTGDFRLCERIPVSAPVIGNVKKGIDLDVLYKVYIKDYGDMSLKICKNCWAINICDSCFVDGFDYQGMSYEKKTEECKNVRSSTEKKIYYFIKVLEIMPDLVTHFQSIKLK